jgi:3-oxoacyl-[acyl-carrier-protein] synthase II
MAGLCSLGQDWKSVRDKVLSGTSGISVRPEYDEYAGFQTRLGACLDGFAAPAHYTRKQRRGMGRCALLATRASELALANALLLDTDLVRGGRLGVAFGSATGSPPEIIAYGTAFGADKNAKCVVPQQYLRMMSPTCAANVARFFGITGRIVPTCSACSAATQAIGFGAEAIRHGDQDVMICGGAEEFHPMIVSVFDRARGTSTRNEDPSTTPRPFDADRDGLVVGEGAAALILEELSHARARGAPILAEIAGYGTNCDGFELVRPHPAGMQRVMELALEDAGLRASEIGYVNAHATATEIGDVAESQATARVFGGTTPVSALKGFFGHTLGACGAIEAWVTIQMMREGWFAPTLNLERVDPACAPLDYIQGKARELQVEYAMSNNFAFGGVNASLIFKRYSD